VLFGKYFKQNCWSLRDAVWYNSISDSYIYIYIYIYINYYWDDIPPKLNSSYSCRVDPQHSNAIKISRVVSDIKYVDRQPPYYAFILYKEGMKSHSASFWVTVCWILHFILLLNVCSIELSTFLPCWRLISNNSGRRNWNAYLNHYTVWDSTRRYTTPHCLLGTNRISLLDNIPDYTVGRVCCVAYVMCCWHMVANRKQQFLSFRNRIIKISVRIFVSVDKMRFKRDKYYCTRQSDWVTNKPKSRTCKYNSANT
jgi:hypothetical protein